MVLAKGTQVRQVIQPIEGEIIGFNIDQETGNRQYLVEWEDAAGELQQKYFSEGEVEAL